ncbi:cytochrome C [Photobacterium proteolyticum]|uniref:Cytochrome C n=1 Tax=Photobacterium proteolyticum TaxID=1903952 RepID=A0A1Q9GT45_9GAMM|nr:c-type cytochrome [Photobacterium proteolyticum]OLQ78274.1 cytochrome C [Photobacterium proteolyticum]
MIELTKLGWLFGYFIICTCSWADISIPGAPVWSTPVIGEKVAHDDQLTLKRITGSPMVYLQEEVDDRFSVPDWFPMQHEPMPNIVKYGKRPDVWACASCHLVSGFGRPESSSLAGLNKEYMLQQLEDFASGQRLDYTGYMNRIASLLSEAEKKDAAKWFASLVSASFIVVKEDTFVPKTFTDNSRMRQITDNSNLELLDYRIIEVPEDIEQARLQSPKAKYISYVPVGSLARGKELVETGAGRTSVCFDCHGQTLSGTESVPSIAGNFGIYTLRQLYGFKSGTRKGKQSAIMQASVVKLSDRDMVDISAYLSSLKRR